MYKTDPFVALILVTLITGIPLITGARPASAGANAPQEKARAMPHEPTRPSMDSPATPEISDTDSVPELVIAGHVVMRIRTRAGILTPQERAYDLRQWLGPILILPNLTPEDVQVRLRPSRQTASIFVRQRLLITVGRNLALANNTSVEGLAQQWAQNLRATLPLINVAVRTSHGTSWNVAAPNRSGTTP